MRMIQRTLVFLLWFATTAAYAAPPEPSWMNTEIIIRGDYFRAALVAYEDFSKKLRGEAQDANTPGYKGDKGLSDYLSHIENYNIQVGWGPGRYQVWISPRASKEMFGIFGGGAMYVIDAKDFKLLQRQYTR
jgi:hypothetical protein